MILGAPSIELNKDFYGLYDEIIITVHDPSIVGVSSEGGIHVLLAKNTPAEKLKIPLNESAPGGGKLVGKIRLTPDKTRFVGDLEVKPGDLLSVYYHTGQLAALQESNLTIAKVIRIATFDPTIYLDKQHYDIGDVVELSIRDINADKNPHVVDIIHAHISSRSNEKGIYLTLTETGSNTGIFHGKFLLTDKSSDAGIKVDLNDEITISHVCEYPADYSERANFFKDPSKTFFITFPVGSLAALHIADNMKLQMVKRYLDPQIIRKIDSGDYLLYPRNKTITIAFWDIRGFSYMCELLKAKPNLSAEFLEEYFAIATRVIGNQGGILDKFIGDGVMALFGVFDENESVDACARACIMSALDFRTEFESLRNKWMPICKREITQDFEIGLGCGINTGEVIVGNIGRDGRNQFTAIGSAVNFASRLEKLAKPTQILISNPTLMRTEGKFLTEYIDIDDKIKNIPGRHRYFQVLGPRKDDEDRSS